MVFSTTTKKLGWEWSDGRKITGKAIVKIEEIKKSNGLFYSYDQPTKENKKVH